MGTILLLHASMVVLAFIEHVNHVLATRDITPALAQTLEEHLVSVEARVVKGLLAVKVPFLRGGSAIVSRRHQTRDGTGDGVTHGHPTGDLRHAGEEPGSRGLRSGSRSRSRSGRRRGSWLASRDTAAGLALLLRRRSSAGSRTRRSGTRTARSARSSTHVLFYFLEERRCEPLK